MPDNLPGEGVLVVLIVRNGDDNASAVLHCSGDGFVLGYLFNSAPMSLLMGSNGERTKVV